MSRQQNGDGPPLGKAGAYKPGQWVQTERSAHEAWSRLCMRKPAAAALLHRLVSSMGHQNAVVVTQAVLAQMLGVTDRTIRSALTALVAERWVQVVRIGKGKEAAYVVNDRVAWGERRSQLNLSVFSAQVVADAEDQDTETLDAQVPLRRIPALYPGEQQLPAGDGEPPPSQADLDGFEPELPALGPPPGPVPAVRGPVALPTPPRRGRGRPRKPAAKD